MVYFFRTTPLISRKGRNMFVRHPLSFWMFRIDAFVVSPSCTCKRSVVTTFEGGRALSVILGMDNSRVDTAFEVNRRNSPVRFSVTPCPSVSRWGVFRRQRLERAVIIRRHCGRCFRGAATNSPTWCCRIRILLHLQRSCRVSGLEAAASLNQTAEHGG